MPKRQNLQSVRALRKGQAIYHDSWNSIIAASKQGPFNPNRNKPQRPAGFLKFKAPEDADIPPYSVFQIDQRSGTETGDADTSWGGLPTYTGIATATGASGYFVAQQVNRITQWFTNGPQLIEENSMGWAKPIELGVPFKTRCDISTEGSQSRGMCGPDINQFNTVAISAGAAKFFKILGASNEAAEDGYSTGSKRVVWAVQLNKRMAMGTGEVRQFPYWEFDESVYPVMRATRAAGSYNVGAYIKTSAVDSYNDSAIFPHNPFYAVSQSAGSQICMLTCHEDCADVIGWNCIDIESIPPNYVA